jgi:zinc protease
VVLASQVHRATLKDFTPLLLEAVLLPGFRQDDLDRHREQLLAFLTTTLRSANDELLGLEMIQQVLFRNHPYGHAPAGTVAGLKSITLEDIRGFYRTHYSRANLILGVGGGYSADYPEALVRALSALPPGAAAPPQPLPPAPPVEGRQFTIVDKHAESAGIHFGYPLPVTRTEADFYPLLVANSYLGEHRTFHGRLMQELRGKRGLNYGDYSYLEYWDNAPGTTNPPPNHPRRQQYFSVWVRPVLPDNALFAMRAAIAEVDRLVEIGLTQEEFELTREFLINYSKLWARSLSDRLAFHMDSRFYGMPYFIERIEHELRGMTLEAVNRAIRRYLQTRHFEAIVISDDAAAMRERLTADRPSPIQYPNPVGEDVLDRDKVIAALPVRPAKISILPIERTFTGVKR